VSVELQAGYSYCRKGHELYIKSPQGKEVVKCVMASIADERVRQFMLSLTEGQLKDMFKGKWNE
jgi:hypothetical protein